MPASLHALRVKREREVDREILERKRISIARQKYGTVQNKEEFM